MNDAVFHAVLQDCSPRFFDWQKVFDGSMVPVQSPIATLANVPGRQRVEVFLLAFDQLQPTTMERLCDHLSERFGTPRGDTEAILREEGLPILAEDVIVVSNGVWFL